MERNDLNLRQLTKKHRAAAKEKNLEYPVFRQKFRVTDGHLAACKKTAITSGSTTNHNSNSTCPHQHLKGPLRITHTALYCSLQQYCEGHCPLSVFGLDKHFGYTLDFTICGHGYDRSRSIKSGNHAIGFVFSQRIITGGKRKNIQLSLLVRQFTSNYRPQNKHKQDSYNMYINQQDAQNSCDYTLFYIRCSTCFELYWSIIRSNFISCTSHLVYAGTICVATSTQQSDVWYRHIPNAMYSL